jgi:hypothetical protein
VGEEKPGDFIGDAEDEAVPKEEQGEKETNEEIEAVDKASSCEW